MSNKLAPFPQANDFEKVVAIVNIDQPERLIDYGYMEVYLGDITDRQVDYYISACMYLGLTDENKTFTNVGNYVRSLFGAEQIAELARIVVSDEIFGTVYFQQKIFGVELESEEVQDIMRRYVELSSDAMYKRRASTVTSWIRWINNQEA